MRNHLTFPSTNPCFLALFTSLAISSSPAYCSSMLGKQVWINATPQLLPHFFLKLRRTPLALFVMQRFSDPARSHASSRRSRRVHQGFKFTERCARTKKVLCLFSVNSIRTTWHIFQFLTERCAPRFYVFSLTTSSQGRACASNGSFREDGNFGRLPQNSPRRSPTQ